MTPEVEDLVSHRDTGLSVAGDADGELPSLEVERARRVYRRFAPLYDVFRAVWSWWTRPVEEDLDRLVRERVGPGSGILELAPGTGINIERLLRCAPDFASYLGIDCSEEMLARARARTDGDGRFELRLGDATDLTEVADTYDFVVSTWLLSHLDAPAATVSEALKKVAPDGTAAFVFFTEPRSKLLLKVVRALGGPFSFDLVDPGPIAELPELERISTCAGGIATIAVFRARAA